MFVDDFVEVRRNVVIANAWLISHGSELTRLAAISPSDPIPRLGEPRTRADVLVLPFHWPGSDDGRFSDLQGDLQTAKLDAGTTHLSIVGSCAIHVEAPGRRPQEQAARRTAERAIREFLGRLAHHIETRSASSIASA
jgi:hypothetical protein